MRDSHKMRLNLRKLIDQEGLIMAPGAYDALTAALIEHAGFPAVYMTGYGVSASLLGKPDIGLITMTEMVQVAHNIVQAVNIPVIADIDTGYGGLLNVIRTIEEFEKAGVSAIQIEDQLFPKRCGHMEGKQLVTTDEMVSRIRAVLEGRNDKDLILIARTDARAVLGFTESINRANAYIEAGADVIFLEAPISVSEVEQICKLVNGPVLINMVNDGKTPFINSKVLQDMGFKIAIYPISPLFSSVTSCLEMLSTLKEKGDLKELGDNKITFSRFNNLLKLDDLRKKELNLL